MQDADIATTENGLKLWERLTIGALFLATFTLGGLVELRSAFLQRRMTDLDVYLRAAWAVRSGADIYTITDDNDWHYHYPPLFAILLTPLADPPANAERSGTVPFAASVALWYLFSVFCMAAAVQILGRAIEHGSKRTPSTRNWWQLRTVPILTCLAPIGHTLVRGQVNLLLLLLVCATIAATLARKPWRAGLWLAGAICLKVIPAFLLIYPVWRRDWRMLAGCAVGLAIGLALIPAMVFGPTQALAYYQEWDEVLRQPALGSGNDQSRAKELLNVTATDSQSFLAIFHNTIYPDRTTRPKQATASLRHIHWLVSSSLLGAALIVGGYRRFDSDAYEMVFFGMIVLLMVVTSPVAHLHYFALSIPLIAGLHAGLLQAEGRHRFLRAAWYLLLGAFFAAQLLPHFPNLEFLRDFGLALYAGLALWLVGALALVRQRMQAGKNCRPLQESKPIAA